MHSNLIERWIPLSLKPDRYEVSDQGRVRSLPFRTVRSNGRPYVHYGGILADAQRRNRHYVMLYLSTKKMTKLWVHHLVLEAFGFPRPSPEHEVNHLNGNPHDNTLSNLEWVSRQENLAHARENKLFYRGDQLSMSKLNENAVREARVLHSQGVSYKRLAVAFGIGKSTIRLAVIGEKWGWVT